MIDIANLAFSYGTSEVLKNISMKLESGRIYGLLGENGVGKTTLLTLLSGLKKCGRGTIRIDGRDPYRREPSLLSDICYLPDEVAPENDSAAGWAACRGRFWPNFTLGRFYEIMRVFENDPAKKMNTMSSGQLKKTYISFALACDTRYLFLDEPTNGLDIPSKSQFRRVVSSCMTDERTIVVSTHQVRDVDALLDHVVVLEGSHVLLDSSTADVCARLCFEERPMGAALGDVLYEQPSMGGHAVVTRNPGGKETPLNLELLFNALLAVPALRGLLSGESGAADVQPENN